MSFVNDGMQHAKMKRKYEKNVMNKHGTLIRIDAFKMPFITFRFNNIKLQ